MLAQARQVETEAMGELRGRRYESLVRGQPACQTARLNFASCLQGKDGYSSGIMLDLTQGLN